MNYKQERLNMDTEIKTITINGKEYVERGSAPQAAEVNAEGLEYKIVRTYSAGVFAGYIEDRDGKEVTLINARRLWHWSGAASLSQLAQSGTSKPGDCKFPEEVSRVVLTEAIEILDVTEQAKKSIDAVKVWKA